MDVVRILIAIKDIALFDKSIYNTDDCLRECRECVSGSVMDLYIYLNLDHIPSIRFPKIP